MKYFISILFLFLSLYIKSEETIFSLVEGCSKTSYCADGYTIDGYDRFGNVRDFVYPKRKVSLIEYYNTIKSYDHEGYDDFGFDRNGYNKNKKNYTEIDILINDYSSFGDSK